MALARTLETFDPAASRRGLRRAGLARQLSAAIGLGEEDLAVTVAGAYLNEICLLVTHDRRADLLNPARSVLSSRVLRSAGLEACADAVHHEFERWGGGGLPTGLVGSDIPVGARVLAAVGAFDEPTIAQMQWLDPVLNEALVSVRDNPAPAPTDLHWLDRQLSALDPERAGSELPLHQILDASRNVLDIVELVAQQTLFDLRASTVSIAQFDQQKGEMRVLVNVGDLGPHDQTRPTAESYPLGSLPATLTSEPGAQRLLSRTNDAGPATLRYLDLRGLSSEAVVPILRDNRVWGIVWVTTYAEHSRQLSPSDLRRLRIVAGDLALAIDRAEQFEEFEALALRDPLTGLWNRRILDEKLSEIFVGGEPRNDAAVIICDVDELKTVNDTLGHSAGDTVLVEAANALREATVNLDDVTVCRIGGDEFSVVIQSRAEELAQVIVDAALARFRRDDPNRSMSCGIAITHPGLTQAGQLMKAADEAQYRQKRMRKEQMGTLPRDQRPPPSRRRQRRDDL